MEKTKKSGHGWESKSIGSNFQHQIFYFLIRFGGFYAAYGLLYFVVLWYVLFYPGIRRKCAPYLRRRFPGTSGLRKLAGCYKMCLMLGKTLIDRSIVAMLGNDRIHIDFPVGERRKLLDVRDENKGLILINSHIGCWQAAMAELTLLQRPVTLLIHKAEGDVDKHFYEQTHMMAPIKVVDPNSYMGGTLELLKALQNREVVCVMGDRLFGNVKNSLPVPFIGDNVRLPISPYKLSANSGAPCVVFQTWKTGTKSYSLKIADIIRPPVRTGLKPGDLRAYVEAYAKTLDEFCRQHPFQFFNFFDMWCDSPDKE